MINEVFIFPLPSFFFLSPALSKGKGDEMGNPIPNPFQRKGRQDGKVLVDKIPIPSLTLRGTK